MYKEIRLSNYGELLSEGFMCNYGSTEFKSKSGKIFKAELDPSNGAVLFSGPDFTIWASPFWDDIEGVPIQHDESDVLTVLELKPTMLPFTDTKAYFKAMSKYIAGLD